MYQLLMVIHVLVAICIIGLVLMQHGKGADIGAAFGSGASNTVFGSQGTGSFLFKLTGALVFTFFVTSLLLSSLVAGQYKQAAKPLLGETIPRQESTIPVPIDRGAE